MEDSLKVTVNEETGEITFEWDPNDTKWNFLHDLTSEEIADMITKHALETLKDETAGE